MTFNENLEWFAAAPSSGIDSAIVGGSLAEEYEFPYVASFQRRGLFGFIHSCGAVIYNQRWVLVAAQCVDKFVFLFTPLDSTWRVLHGKEKNFSS